MIQNARVFQEDHIPRKVPHRNTEKNQLSRALNPIEEGESGEKATFLFGPSGTGKTCLSRFILRQLEEEVLEVNTHYVNCWNHYSRFGALYEVLNGFTGTADVHRQSTPTEEVLGKVQEYDGPPYVVVLDEVDQLDDKRVLYDLYRVQNFSMVLIANREEELFAELDERLVSRLHSSRRISLNKYGLNELVDILQERVKHGLIEDVVSRQKLELIADIAAGDARYAIRLLGISANEARQQGLKQITREVIKEMTNKARKGTHKENLQKLKEHQRVLYDILKEHGEMDPGEVYAQYQQRVEEPKTDRTVRKYLQKLIDYDLVEAKGEKRGRTYNIKQP